MGVARMNFDWDWAGAEKEYQRSIELDPTYATTHAWYSVLLSTALARKDDALAEARQAQSLDPLSLIINCDVGVRFYFARQYDKAIEQYHKTLEMDPNFPVAHIWLGRAYEQKGMYQEAIAEYQIKVMVPSGDKQPAASVGHAYAASGFRSTLREQLNELKELSTQRYVSSLDIAAIYARLGEENQAFEWLDKAYEERCSLLPWLKLDPRLDSLRPHARFTELLKKVGLPE